MSQDERPVSHRRVRVDLAAGLGILTLVIVGKLLWHASDAGILAALAAR